MEERALRGRQLRRAPARALFAQPLLRARLVRPLFVIDTPGRGLLGQGKARKLRTGQAAWGNELSMRH